MNHKSLASCIELMRLAPVGVSLGVGGVTSGMTRWCSRRCPKYENVRGAVSSEREMTSGMTE